VSHVLRAICSHLSKLRLSATHSPQTYGGRSSSAQRAAQLGLLLSVLTPVIVCAGCGKVGAPVAPSRLTERTSEVTAIQRGANILLSWPSPALVREDSSRFYISRVDVFRLTERRDQEPVLDPDDFEATAQIIGFLDRAAIEAQVKILGHLQFTDTINLSQSKQLANTRLRYAVRYINKREQAASFSNTVAIEPAPGITMPPTGLSVKAEAQDVVTITWNAPATNVDGVTAASVVGYNVYRRLARQEFGGELLNSELISGTGYVDSKFQYLADYVYFVRALSQGANGLIESADSQAFAFTPIDKFPPPTPEPVSIASANGSISLFWPSSAERDVAGYYVYRAGSADTPDKDWIKLNDQPVTAVTFRDDRVVVDQTYFYRVTAVDRFNNESERSRVVSETAHP
jgi:hypothetical protein